MNIFKLNGKTYKHEIYTRALEIDRNVLVCNAPASVSDTELERVALGGAKMEEKFVGSLNLNSETGEWNDNTGIVQVNAKLDGKVTPDFSYEIFSDFTRFEEACK